jgi:hypothetical protein
MIELDRPPQVLKQKKPSYKRVFEGTNLERVITFLKSGAWTTTTDGAVSLGIDRKQFAHCITSIREKGYKLEKRFNRSKFEYRIKC